MNVIVHVRISGAFRRKQKEKDDEKKRKRRKSGLPRGETVDVGYTTTSANVYHVCIAMYNVYSLT